MKKGESNLSKEEALNPIKFSVSIHIDIIIEYTFKDASASGLENISPKE